MTFCKDCGANVEWHKTAAGRDMPIDVDATPEGNYYFEKVRLVHGQRGSKPKMYTSHFDTCKKRRPAPAFVCERAGCDVKSKHLHCFECGETDHLKAECPDGPADGDGQDGDWGQR